MVQLRLSGILEARILLQVANILSVIYKEKSVERTREDGEKLEKYEKSCEESGHERGN